MAEIEVKDVKDVTDSLPVKVTVAKPIDRPKKIEAPKTIAAMEAEERAVAPSKVEPAAGFSSAPKMVVTSGNYFVQRPVYVTEAAVMRS